MDHEPVPIEHSCLGCKRYFLLHEILPLQSMTIQFKNYSIPIKEKHFKVILLKTIVAFMNGKGGSIFIGVDDASGQVEGMTLGRKQMDEFRLVVKQLLEKVIPSVDLVKEEEVFVQFVPVLQGKQRNFYGKYVIKFIVRQGDPSKLYCVSEKINTFDGKEIEVISAFRRHNLGGIEELKGIKVIQQIYEKARNPYKPYETFHKNCNPHPILPSLAQRQKIDAIPRIFADGDSEDSSEKPPSSRQSRKRSFSQASESGTIIQKIQELDTTIIDEKDKPKERTTVKINRNPFKTADEAVYVVYFQNVRECSILKMINYLKNSTQARLALQINDENGIVCVKMKSKSDRDSLISQMTKDPYKRLINEFGSNGRINMLKTLSIQQVKTGSKSQQNTLIPSSNPDSNSLDIKPYAYRLKFSNYVKNLENSVENYLKNSININIKRKMRKGKDEIELLFQNKKDMCSVYELCLNPPHNRLLGQFWTKGVIKIQKYEKVQSQNCFNGKQEQKTPEKKVKLEVDTKDLPELMNMIDKIDQEENLQKPIQLESSSLIASSLQPSQVSKLSNYLVNNMFYNIQKRIFSSKDRYYIRIVFNNANECKEFLSYCRLDQHKKMLAQFTAGAKAFRIGVPGENLLISPYNENTKDELRNLIVRVLGRNAIQKSTVKEIEKQKVWSLTLLNPEKILEYYEKLEDLMRKEGFFINNEWHRFKVYIEYINIAQ